MSKLFGRQIVTQKITIIEETYIVEPVNSVSAEFNKQIPAIQNKQEQIETKNDRLNKSSSASSLTEEQIILSSDSEDEPEKVAKQSSVKVNEIQNEKRMRVLAHQGGVPLSELKSDTPIYEQSVSQVQDPMQNITQVIREQYIKQTPTEIIKEQRITQIRKTNQKSMPQQNQTKTILQQEIGYQPFTQIQQPHQNRMIQRSNSPIQKIQNYEDQKIASFIPLDVVTEQKIVENQPNFAAFDINTEPVQNVKKEVDFTQFQKIAKEQQASPQIKKIQKQFLDKTAAQIINEEMINQKQFMPFYMNNKVQNTNIQVKNSQNIQKPSLSVQQIYYKETPTQIIKQQKRVFQVSNSVAQNKPTFAMENKPTMNTLPVQNKPAPFVMNSPIQNQPKQQVNIVPFSASNVSQSSKLAEFERNQKIMNIVNKYLPKQQIHQSQPIQFEMPRMPQISQVKQLYIKQTPTSYIKQERKIQEISNVANAPSNSSTDRTSQVNSNQYFFDNLQKVSQTASQNKNKEKPVQIFEEFYMKKTPTQYIKEQKRIQEIPTNIQPDINCHESLQNYKQAAINRAALNLLSVPQNYEIHVKKTPNQYLRQQKQTKVTQLGSTTKVQTIEKHQERRMDGDSYLAKSNISSGSSDNENKVEQRKRKPIFNSPRTNQVVQTRQNALGQLSLQVNRGQLQNYKREKQIVKKSLNGVKTIQKYVQLDPKTGLQDQVTIKTKIKNDGRKKVVYDHKVQDTNPGAKRHRFSGAVRNIKNKIDDILHR